jgi:hypothetical protein
LCAKPLESVVLNSCAMIARDPHCVILAATIHDDPLVTKRKRIKAIRDLGSLVPGNDNGGQPRHSYSPVDNRMGIPYSQQPR